MLDFGADVNVKSVFGYSPFGAAINARDTSCVKLLLKHISDMNERDGQEWLPLHSCSYFDCDINILETILIRTTHINSTIPSTKDTALMITAQENRTEICERLIFHGASTDMANSDGETALHRAVCHKSGNSLELLLQNQANPLLKTHAGETLLHYAAQYGDLKCMEILYAFDLSGINVADKVNGFSPIQNLKDVKGLTALEIVEERRNGSSEWFAMFRKLIRGIEYPESKTTEAEISSLVEVEDFQDAVEYQE